MAIIKSVKGLTPRWGKECYFSENAAIVGEVTMGDECSVWFNAVVRGDVAPVTMGDRVNVQDGAVVHVTNKIGPTIIEDDVTIGHNATVHACTLKRGCLIGMGSIIAMLASSDSPFTAFHVRQALKISILGTLTGLAALVLCWTIIVPIAAGIFETVLFVVRIICFVRICQGKAIEAPVVRGFSFMN